MGLGREAGCGQEASNFPGSYCCLRGVSAESTTGRWKPSLLVFIHNQKQAIPQVFIILKALYHSLNIQLPPSKIKTALHLEIGQARNSFYCRKWGLTLLPFDSRQALNVSFLNRLIQTPQVNVSPLTRSQAFKVLEKFSTYLPEVSNPHNSLFTSSSQHLRCQDFLSGLLSDCN